MRKQVINIPNSPKVSHSSIAIPDGTYIVMRTPAVIATPSMTGLILEKIPTLLSFLHLGCPAGQRE